VVKDSNDNIVASGVGSDDSGQGYVQLVVSFTGVPGETYTATSAHSVFEIYTVEYYNDGDPQPIFQGYDDMYDFGFYSENPQTYDDYFEWDSPGPETVTTSRLQRQGVTAVKKNYPKATITFSFNNSKNTQDALMFASASVCSESLGPTNCSDFWSLSFEGTVVVSDDASKWTVKQSIVSGNSDFYAKDSSGTLHHATQPATPGSDGPTQPDGSKGLLQNNPGSHNIFWLDSPGTPKTVTDNISGEVDLIDSIIHTKNFTVSVCSTVYTSICATANWYIKVVVNPGRQFDRTNSTGGMGTAP
jgi:hypothetical protein